MVTRHRAIVPLLFLPLALVAACDKVPLLAPTGTVINLFPVTTTVSLNSEVTIIATVIENGVASGGSGSPTGGSTSRTGNGTPVQNGTVISFTTSIGRIEPAEARTTNGQVNVRLITGSTSGRATITAFSGGASSQLTLDVGTQAASQINVIATPPNLGANGGTALITASVLDGGGNGVGGVPVNFTTDRGTLSPTTANTDPSGNATVSLTTSGTAKVTAVAGTKNGSVTVNVNARSLASFIATPTTPTVAGSVSFEVTAGSGANLNNVRVEFGDGSSTDLGAIVNKATTPHAYCTPGQYTATAKASDATGDPQQLSTNVLVSNLPATLAATGTLQVDNPVTFTVTLTGNSTAPLLINRFTWTWDDGTPSFSTSGASTTHTFTTRGQKTVRVDVSGVGCGQVATATIVVNVS